MSDTKVKQGPIVLAILDGWGLAGTWRGNAINFANPPTFGRLWREYPHVVLAAVDHASPATTPPDSNLNHATIGAGRWVRSDREEISTAIKRGLFNQNQVLGDAFRAAREGKRTIHLIGLLSDAGVESDLGHLQALLMMARDYQVPSVLIHVITDGLDCPPRRAVALLNQVEDLVTQAHVGVVASLIGRNDALPDSGHVDQVIRAYRLWVSGKGIITHNLARSLRAHYAQGITDRFMPPLRIPAGPAGEPIVHDRDVVIVWQSRSRHLVPLTRAFLDPPALRPFIRRVGPLRKLTKFVTLVAPELTHSLPVEVAFPPGRLPTTLAEILSGRGLRQLRLSDSSKEMTLTSFLSGGRVSPYAGEERIFMRQSASSPELLVETLRKQLTRGQTDVVFLNLSAVDWVAHRGDLFATAAAVRAVDRALDHLVETVLAEHGTLLITADHGQAEELLSHQNHSPNFYHTKNPVPFLFVAHGQERNLMRQAIALPFNLVATLARPTGGLPDIAPTILHLLGIPIPVEMTGQSLLDQLHS